jgi:uncharacterized protein YndB with AHSA1/START domain
MTTDAREPLADARAHPDGDRWTLVLARDLPHPPERVWRALTAVEHLPRWAPFASDVDLGAPGPASLTMLGGAPGSDPEVAPGEVLTAERPRLLVYRWGDDVLRWELAPAGTGTRLVLAHTVADRTWTSKVAAGWHLCLANLDAVLAGRPVEPVVGAAAAAHGWDDLERRYADVLGVESSGWPDTVPR